MLLRDHRDDFLPAERCTDRSFLAVVEAAAAVNARFLGDTSLQDPRLGLCTPRDYYSFFPHTVVVGGPMSWDILAPHYAPATIEIVRALLSDPTPLCRFLDGLPHTQ